MIEARRVQPGARAHVRILATTDLHMNLTSHDYHADRPDPTIGLTRTATLIEQARKDAENDGALVLLFDNGDSLQGTPLSDLAHEQPDRDHPLMRAFGHLRYDAIGLGNHDFNFGLRTLEFALRQAPCPVLCSNLRHTRTGGPAGFQPFSILDRMVHCGTEEWPVRFGILSFVPPQTVQWDADILDGEIEADAIVANARTWLPELKAAGCDVIIALAHSGLGDAQEHPELENAVLPLAALDGIDVVVAGHTHLRFPGPDHAGLEHVDAVLGTVHDKPTVMPGSSGSHLGVIDLDLVATDNQQWAPSDFTCELRPISIRDCAGNATALARENQKLVDILADTHHHTRGLMDQPVGHSAVSLHSYFTFFAPDRALALVAAAQAAALRPYLTGTEAESLPVLSASAPGKFGARAGPAHYTDVPAGSLTLRNVADLHVFENQVRAVIVTGQQLCDWIEMSVSLFNQLEPNLSDQELINPEMPGHNFDVLHGLRYQIDLAMPSRYAPDGRLIRPNCHRLCHTSHNGQPVRPDDRFVVALNSYRVNGGGPFGMLGSAAPVQIPSITLRDAIRAYLSGENERERMQAASPWSFAPIPGAVATVLTGPGALAHLDEISERGVCPCGQTPEGFLQLEVPF